MYRTSVLRGGVLSDIVERTRNGRPRRAAGFRLHVHPMKPPETPSCPHAGPGFMGAVSCCGNSDFRAYPHKTEWCRFSATQPLPGADGRRSFRTRRSEEHTSELQSLMRNSYAVFCLKKKKYNNTDLYT